MKFQIREGMVAKITTKIDIGDGKTETQENTVFGGQVVDLSADQAELHAHKLEPKDKAAEAYLASKVMPVDESAQIGLPPQALALVKEMATQMATQIVAQVLAAKPAAATA